MVDPQRSMQRWLRRVAARWNGTLLPVAAWTSDGGQLEFHTSANSEASSLVQGMARRYISYTKPNFNETTTVNTIDIARVVRETLQDATLALIKLDVEGAEYTVLPWLLRQGAFCSKARQHLIIEWHLNALLPDERLAGLGLRLSAEHTLRESCGSKLAPRTVEHEEYIGNNRGEPIPGLADLLRTRTKPLPRDMGTKKTRPWSEALRTEPASR